MLPIRTMMIQNISGLLAVVAVSSSVTSAFQAPQPFLSTRNHYPSSTLSYYTNARINNVDPSTTTMFPFKSSTDDNDSWGGPSKSAMIGGAGVNNAGEPPFEIRGFSLGNLVCGAGVVVTVASFVDYLSENSDTLSVSGLGFVYGIPIFLAGAALKYAEIEPVPVYTSKKAADNILFEKKATDTIRKIKQDVTRHRYGDEAHLDTTVKKLGLVVPGKAYPQLRELREDATEDGGELIFTMVWQSLDTPYKMWSDERRVKKYSNFFGPGVIADVIKIDAEQRLVGIQLTTTSSSSTTATTTSTTTTTEEAEAAASVSA